MKMTLNEIDMSKGVPLELFMENVIPNRYLIFKTGGYHYFSQCTIDIDPIYKQPIWPFLYSIKNNKKDKYGEPIFGSISLTKLSYVVHRIVHKHKKRERIDYRNKDKELKRFTPWEKEILMHRMVARAFVKNTNPEKYTMVDHINGNRIDYRPENLRWTNAKENNHGSPGGRNDPNEIYRKISNQKWFNGGGSNMIMTHKKIWMEKRNER